MSERQEYVDRFYWQNGPCCAGCDWWRHINSVAGECERRAPSLDGFPMTTRDQHCGDFQDEFDWSSLPIAYRRKVGAPANQERP